MYLARLLAFLLVYSNWAMHASALEMQKLVPFGAVQRITQPSTGPFDDLGFSVDSSGDLMIAGAINVNAADGSDVGAAYVYRKSNSGEWQQISELMADDAEHNAGFGWDVAIDNNNVLVGAALHGSFLSQTEGEGAAYFFKQNAENQWDQVASFNPPVDVEWFGRDLAMEGSLAAVSGTMRVSFGPGPREQTGFLQVYRENDGEWNATQQLITGDQLTTVSDISISEGRLAFGVASRPSPGSPVTFGVRIYEDDGQEFRYVDTISLPPEISSLGFGWSVSLDHDQILIGARGNDGRGAVYHFRETEEGRWDRIARIALPDADNRFLFGTELELEGSLATINSWVGEGNLGDGIVHVFELSDGQWIETSGLESEFSSFGTALSISEEVIFVGSGVNVPGAVDVFSRVPEPPLTALALLGIAVSSKLFYREI